MLIRPKRVSKFRLSVERMIKNSYSLILWKRLAEHSNNNSKITKSVRLNSVFGQFSCKWRELRLYSLHASLVAQRVEEELATEGKGKKEAISTTFITSFKINYCTVKGLNRE